MANVLVTGCSRGIGLELCRQFRARGDEVTGVCRTASPELKNLGVRVVDGVDVSEPAAARELQRRLAGARIDILVNNAGILRRDGLEDPDFDGMLEQFRVNTLGPLRITHALLDNLGEGSKVAIVTSRMGSVADNTSGGYYGYRVSKAGVNMIGMSLRHDLEPRGIAVALLHPGMVATGMTGGQGIDVQQAAAGLIQRIDELDMSNSGSFWHAEGYALPW